MFEDLFEFSDNIIPDSQSGMITFEEYLSKKPVIESVSDVPTMSGMITFEEYLAGKAKNQSEIVIDSSESFQSENGMMTFLEYLESKNLLVNDEIESNNPQELLTKKSLWDGYVQHVKNKVVRPAVINIQDPKYLDESRARYAEFLIEEQRKVLDKIYFFTPGGRAIEEEPTQECAVIGKAVIGKNKIC